MKTLNFKIALFLLANLAFTGKLFAQEKLEKSNKTFQVDNNVSIEVDAKYTSLIFETWDKNVVEVEAFIEGGGLSEEEKQGLLANWNLEVIDNSGEIRISSQGSGMNFLENFSMDTIFNGEDFAFIEPLMENMIGPMLEEIAEMPVLEPSFYENMGSLEFDYETYKKEGEDYLKKYEKQIEQSFGDDFEAKMEKWGKQFEERMEARGEVLDERMEKWGEEFAKRMEARGKIMEERMEQMEIRSETLANRREEMAKRMEHITVLNSKENVQRTIHVRMPESAVLNLDVRHGKVELTESTNLIARLSHTPFTAFEINGEETKVNVSYAPVNISNWNYGVLDLGYVGNCVIDRAKSIKLTSNSSDLKIKEVQETAIVSGTFGELDILGLAFGFNLLDITLENTNFSLNLPNTALNFNYNGSQSNITYPESIKATPVKSYDTEIINGFQESKDANGTVNITAKFSDVEIK